MSYDMVQRNLLWLCPKRNLTSWVFIFQNAKIQKFLNDDMSYQSHMMLYTTKTLLICYLLSCWALSNCLWPLLRFSPCTHDQDSRTPTYKNDNSYTKSYPKTCFFGPPKIKTPFICHDSFSPKFFICQARSIGLC